MFYDWIGKQLSGQLLSRDKCGIQGLGNGMKDCVISINPDKSWNEYSIRGCCDYNQFDQVLVELWKNYQKKEPASHYGKSMAYVFHSFAKMKRKWKYVFFQ